MPWYDGKYTRDDIKYKDKPLTNQGGKERSVADDIDKYAEDNGGLSAPMKGRLK
jgi:hypothetical protein